MEGHVKASSIMNSRDQGFQQGQMQVKAWNLGRPKLVAEASISSRAISWIVQAYQ